MTDPMLTFLGGAGTVTGSCFAVSTDAGQVFVDAGLYQGLRDLRRRNWDRSDPAPAGLDAIVVTHAHLDHCGLLPRLVRDGFSGPIVCTPETAELVAIMLRDSAHLQEEDARLANEGGYSRHRPALPLYDLDDVERTLPHLLPVAYETWVDLAAGTRALLTPAGHILGSACAVVDVEGHRAVFSGDLGRGTHPLLPPAGPRPAAATVVVESTYGDRRHPPPDSGVLAGAVRRTIGRGGTVLIPAFAVDRTELVILELHRLMAGGQIPRVPVHLDSPMALAALGVYRRASAELGAAIDGLRLHAVRDAAGSMRLNDPVGP
ncbi:MBL fold metallo-hydrolase [Nocardioides pyridinolyticus]